ncbi:hypothetical protein [Streptomyces sp. CC210A]|uniref:hypothetical protein n=1 Tax=Streptomyces sp. CC210A TaxID=2898184 RepID=UPI001F3954BE|nr:hypothetical protein [Streptomyces sp. CC210A]
MKSRHVRALAVFGIALVALTGARGSHGGSCSGSSSGSSSSSGSGSSGDHGSDDGVGKSDTDTGTDASTAGSGSGSGSSGGSGSGGGSGSSAMRDVRIDGCEMDADTKKLVARITVTNNGALDYAYDFTVRFKGDTGGTALPATARVNDLEVAAGAKSTAEASAPYTGGGDGSEYTRCVVTKASRTLA